MRPHPFRRGNQTPCRALGRHIRRFNEAPPIQAGKLEASQSSSSVRVFGFNEAPPIQAGKPACSGS